MGKRDVRVMGGLQGMGFAEQLDKIFGFFWIFLGCVWRKKKSMGGGVLFLDMYATVCIEIKGKKGLGRCIVLWAGWVWEWAGK
ncbi:hypothetical protein KY284_007182 [Solanum tuberosum]|nr:hypothetical protein KY284_007181 [Solanum tuberosum]KAH0714277.1 hypothetical protein KY284_007182 [Solanum tuberosum]